MSLVNSVTSRYPHARKSVFSVEVDRESQNTLAFRLPYAKGLHQLSIFDTIQSELGETNIRISRRVVINPRCAPNIFSMRYVRFTF